MLQDYQFLDEVPAEHQKQVDAFRKFLRDYPEVNELLADRESTDLELYNALIDTWDQINNEFEPTDLHFNKLRDIPWGILRQGATLNIFVSVGILSARNVLTYNDSGGITVKDEDVFGRYMALFNMLVNQYRRSASGFKRTANLNRGFGGVESEYSNQWW